MNSINSILTAQSSQIAVGVVAAAEDGTALVAFGTGCERTTLACDLMHSSQGTPLRLARGDKVIVWHSGDDDERGVILGRVGSRQRDLAETSDAAARPSAATEIPEELVIEAKHGLTLKCGEGSITIRADGKILIKGRDLVSHAQRTNRIRGGAVAIN